jgi:hypothetical protein
MFSLVTLTTFLLLQIGLLTPLLGQEYDTEPGVKIKSNISSEEFERLLNNGDPEPELEQGNGNNSYDSPYEPETNDFLDTVDEELFDQPYQNNDTPVRKMTKSKKMGKRYHISTQNRQTKTPSKNKKKPQTKRTTKYDIKGRIKRQENSPLKRDFEFRFTPKKDELPQEKKPRSFKEMVENL